MKIGNALGILLTGSVALCLAPALHAQAPTVVSAVGEYDSGTSIQYVDVTFSEPMNAASVLNPANYSISGQTISGITLFTNNLGVGSTTMAVIELLTPLTGPFTLTVNNVQSVSSVLIATNTTVNATVDPLTSIDIGSFTVDGTTYCLGPGAYMVDASGDDIYGTADGFRFVYETKTNNFDVVVQVPSLLPADQWSRAGLMARETIDPFDGGSRFFDVVTTAAASQTPLDGGNGENSLSVDARATTEGSASEPVGFVGDGTVKPSYPNQWLRLQRQTDGVSTDVFTAYSSTDEVNWTLLASWTPVTNGMSTLFPSNVFVGMCTTAHIAFTATPDTYLATATYQNFGDYLNLPVLSATASAGKLTISWTPTGGALYSSPGLGPNANWQLVGTNNPTSVSITGASEFFEVISP